MAYKYVRPALAWSFGLLAVTVVIGAYLTKREPIDQSHTAEQRKAIANQGLHCSEGTLRNDSYSGGFQKSEPVIIDGQFVNCAMKYTVNNQELTLEEILVKFLNEKRGG